MNGVYRKFGRTVRREGAMLVRVDEAGQSIEGDDTFECTPIDETRALPDVDTDAVHAMADAVPDAERVLVSEGVAIHEYGGEQWSERSRRVHAAVAHAHYRALIDLAEFDAAAVRRVADALRRIEGPREIAHVRMADNVGAALLPMLIGEIAMQQWAAPRDGRGNWIENVQVTAREPPNWFRPSYRSRPMRAWLHLRADPFGEIDPTLPEAIALLAPIHGRTLQVLCVEGGRSFAATIEVNRVLAAAPAETWYPFAAGCFGAEMML